MSTIRKQTKGNASSRQSNNCILEERVRVVYNIMGEPRREVYKLNWNMHGFKGNHDKDGGSTNSDTNCIRSPSRVAPICTDRKWCETLGTPADHAAADTIRLCRSLLKKKRHIACTEFSSPPTSLCEVLQQHLKCSHGLAGVIEQRKLQVFQSIVTYQHCSSLLRVVGRMLHVPGAKDISHKLEGMLDEMMEWLERPRCVISGPSIGYSTNGGDTLWVEVEQLLVSRHQVIRCIRSILGIKRRHFPETLVEDVCSLIMSAPTVQITTTFGGMAIKDSTSDDLVNLEDILEAILALAGEREVLAKIAATNVFGPNAVSGRVLSVMPRDISTAEAKIDRDGNEIGNWRDMIHESLAKLNVFVNSILRHDSKRWGCILSNQFAKICRSGTGNLWPSWDSKAKVLNEEIALQILLRSDGRPMSTDEDEFYYFDFILLLYGHILRHGVVPPFTKSFNQDVSIGVERIAYDGLVDYIRHATFVENGAHFSPFRIMHEVDGQGRSERFSFARGAQLYGHAHTIQPEENGRQKSTTTIGPANERMHNASHPKTPLYVLDPTQAFEPEGKNGLSFAAEHAKQNSQITRETTPMETSESTLSSSLAIWVPVESKSMLQNDSVGTSMYFQFPGSEPSRKALSGKRPASSRHEHDANAAFERKCCNADSSQTCEGRPWRQKGMKPQQRPAISQQDQEEHYTQQQLIGQELTGCQQKPCSHLSQLTSSRGFTRNQQEAMTEPEQGECKVNHNEPNLQFEQTEKDQGNEIYTITQKVLTQTRQNEGVRKSHSSHIPSSKGLATSKPETFTETKHGGPKVSHSAPTLHLEQKKDNQENKNGCTVAQQVSTRNSTSGNSPLRTFVKKIPQTITEPIHRGSKVIQVGQITDDKLNIIDCTETPLDSNEAALRINRFLTACAARSRLDCMHLQKRKIVLIQNLFRAWKSRDRVKVAKSRGRIKAATILQKNQRARAARLIVASLQLKKTRMSTTCNAILIQGQVGKGQAISSLLLRPAETSQDEMSQAITCVQKYERRRQSIVRFGDMRKSALESSVRMEDMIQQGMLQTMNSIPEEAGEPGGFVNKEQEKIHIEKKASSISIRETPDKNISAVGEATDNGQVHNISNLRDILHIMTERLKQRHLFTQDDCQKSSTDNSDFTFLWLIDKWDWLSFFDESERSLLISASRKFRIHQSLRRHRIDGMIDFDELRAAAEVVARKLNHLQCTEVLDHQSDGQTNKVIEEVSYSQHDDHNSSKCWLETRMNLQSRRWRSVAYGNVKPQSKVNDRINNAKIEKWHPINYTLKTLHG